MRWKIELDDKQLKGELGLDHYEGRSWLGWYHHTALVTAARGFLTLERQHPNHPRLGSSLRRTSGSSGSSSAGPAAAKRPTTLGAFRVHDESKTFAATKIALAEAATLRTRCNDRELSPDEMEQQLRPFFRNQKALHLCQLAFDRLPLPRVDVLE